MLDLCRPAAELLQLQQTLMEQCFPASTVLLPSGAQVAVRQCGQRSGKPSIVLLHGISSGAASWLHPALLLAEHHHVLAWDAPGYGESTPVSDTSPSAQASFQRGHGVLFGTIIYVGVSHGQCLQSQQQPRDGPPQRVVGPGWHGQHRESGKKALPAWPPKPHTARVG